MRRIKVFKDDTSTDHQTWSETTILHSTNGSKKKHRFWVESTHLVESADQRSIKGSWDGSQDVGPANTTSLERADPIWPGYPLPQVPGQLINLTPSLLHTPPRPPLIPGDLLLPIPSPWFPGKSIQFVHTTTLALQRPPSASVWMKRVEQTRKGGGEREGAGEGRERREGGRERGERERERERESDRQTEQNRKSLFSELLKVLATLIKINPETIVSFNCLTSWQLAK